MRVIHYLLLDSAFPVLGRSKIKANHFNFSRSHVPLAPQIVFVWDELAFKAVTKEWSEAKFQNKVKITNSKKERGKYSIVDVVEFCVPTLVNVYLKDKRKLEQKFLKAQKIYIVMPLEKPEESEIALFYNSLPDNLKGKTQRVIKDTSDKSEQGYGKVLSVPHTESNLYRAFMRSMVKNVFHSFLYAYSIHSPYNKDLVFCHSYIDGS